MSTASNMQVPATTQDDVPFPSFEAWQRIRGDLIEFPHAREDYEAQKAFAAAHVTYTSCVSCKERFSDANCSTEAGWMETQISGLCERCFDAVTADRAAEEDKQHDRSHDEPDSFESLGLSESDFLPSDAYGPRSDR